MTIQELIDELLYVEERFRNREITVVLDDDDWDDRVDIYDFAVNKHGGLLFIEGSPYKQKDIDDKFDRQQRRMKDV